MSPKLTHYYKLHLDLNKSMCYETTYCMWLLNIPGTCFTTAINDTNKEKSGFNHKITWWFVINKKKRLEKCTFMIFN